MTAAPQNLRVIGDRIEQLLDELRAAAPPAVYDKTEELLRLVTELYAAGLGRVVEVAGETPAILARLVDDELVASLLLVHGLHPDSLGARVERALDSVRPFLAQHGGDVELLDIDADVGAVLLRLLGSCDGCPSSAVTLQHAVERAIIEAAPEIVTIEVEDVPKPDLSVPVTLGPKPVYDQCPSDVSA
ncbi:MAG: hypothetical protein QOD72_2748 [Acidimicrobiaceae bacterium]|jgi:Fe-S cluster biogenesis protein NfuA|nr:hypothetical protein [Acidimicrobiaceae bacterium]